MATTPTRRKKRLGAHLERLRSDAGKALLHAAELLRVDESTVSRYETGHVRPSWAAMQALLGYYGASEEDRAEAAVLWEDAGDKSLRVVTPAGSPRPFREFLRAEAEADTERTLAPQVVPGLLQTAAYTRALNARGQQFHNRTTRPERYVSARLSRQARLTEPNPIRVHALVDEAVIRRLVGGPAVMAEQLRHLITVARQDIVMLQVVPFEAGSYGDMRNGFTITGYDGADDPSIVYLENVAGGALVENEGDVGRFEAMFIEVAELALTPAKSAQLIKSQVRALERP